MTDGAGRAPGRSLRRQHGFGMIELLVVLIIIGILSAIAVPIYLAQRDRSKQAVLKENLHNVRIALSIYMQQDLDTTYRRSDDSPGSATEAANAARYVSNGLEVGLENGVPTNNKDGYANPYSQKRAIVNWTSLPSGATYDRPAVFITNATGARWDRINTYASRSRLAGSMVVVWNTANNTIETYAVGGNGLRISGSLTTVPR